MFANWHDFYILLGSAWRPDRAVAALFNSALAVGVVCAVLLVCGIRNAWDLITWIAPRGGAAGSLAEPPEQ